MMKTDENFLDLSETSSSEILAKAQLYRRRWQILCERYLPVKESIWRLSRNRKQEEPPQGWKLHVSATILEACDLFEKVAPFLIAQDVRFKAPKSLEELSKLNQGLDYGYHQVGKFITVYPATETQAVRLARELDELTGEFISISIPFDEQFSPNSSVFYRYGSFVSIEMTDENGNNFPAIKNPVGKLVLDDRLQAVPEWLSNPFQNNGKNVGKTFADTPLGTTYKIFRAITQRGKGGTYQAFDFSRDEPRLCIVKEGRRHGEVGWDGKDGYCLVKNEFEVLNSLKKKYDDVPQVFASFEIHGNFYVALEYVAGKSLHNLMKPRQRRFSISQIIKFAIEIAKIIEEIHKTGWIWNDCKPANLIVTSKKSLRPIDFEGAYPANQTALFDWKTRGFSKSAKNSPTSNGKSDDLYALGAVIYFLLTGKLYDADAPIEIAELRRRVPQKLIEVIENLLSGSVLDSSEATKEFEEIQKRF